MGTLSIKVLLKAVSLVNLIHLVSALQVRDVSL